MKSCLSSRLIWLLLALGLGGVLAIGAAQGVAALSNGAPPEVILEQPVLTPAYGDLCETYWYRFTNERSQDAFLTLNATSVAHSTNAGEWRPTLAQSGLYRIEAFIPAHAPIVWDCGNPRTIQQDTTEAHYRIQGHGGSYEVILDQAAHAGQWAELGVFLLDAGAAGAVHLTDLNALEAEFTRSVSFSAMRFTWVGPSNTLILPALYANVVPGQALIVEEAWAATRNDIREVDFAQQEQLHLTVQGLNTGLPRPADFWWHIAGPCGDSLLPQQSATVNSGSWRQVYTTTLPACVGPYTATVQVAAQDFTATLLTHWTVYPGSELQIRQQQAFDKCNAPSLSQMAAWWQSGPYHGVNLYIGGVSRSCANSHLNRSWVKQVQEMGWFLIPTWVGPQAPCTSFPHVFSLDPQIAFAQGRSEADQAYAAALALGLFDARSGATTIYYDLEGYSRFKPEQDCKTAAQQFVWGWGSRMKELGQIGAIYGGACSSYMLDWLGSPFTPDVIWAAAWYTNTYDAAATVWHLPCVRDELWANHQRIRQYAGDHTENWGGVNLTIDSNAVDSWVVAPRLVSDTLPTAAAIAWETSPRLRAFQRLSLATGWVLLDDRWLWTDDAGEHWQDLTPQFRLEQAAFLDESRGWALTLTAAGWQVYQTADARQWQPVAGLLPLDGAAQVYQFERQTEQIAWLAARLPSSANFRLGVLLRTQDAGQSWQAWPLPSAGRLWFESDQQAWLRTEDGQVYRTLDAGKTWSGVAKPALFAVPEALFSQDLTGSSEPKIFELQSAVADAPRLLWALEVSSRCEDRQTAFSAEVTRFCRQQSHLWASDDGGQSWQRLGPLP